MAKKSPISVPILALLAQICALKIFFREFYLNVTHCCKLSLYPLKRKTNIQIQENGEKPHFGPDLGPLGPNSDR